MFYVISGWTFSGGSRGPARIDPFAYGEDKQSIHWGRTMINLHARPWARIVFALFIVAGFLPVATQPAPMPLAPTPADVEGRGPASGSKASQLDTPWPTVGWTWSSPEEQGMDSALLTQASSYIELNCPTRFSLLVARHGRLVFEEYYQGSDLNQANNIKSISKSILSVLTGIALEEGLLTGVDQKLDEFFPEYFRPVDDPRKHDITLEHLLTMTAGFEWEENSAIAQRCFESQDWHRFIIESPLTDTPGEIFNYNTALTHLLSGIFTKVSGTTTLDFAASRLFSPLGMTCVRWSQDPRGCYFGGSEVWLTARDLATFGLLFLRQGRWEDQQIVSEQWLRDSSRLRVRTGTAGWGFGDYGYLWWKKTISGYPVTQCSGYGGQYIFLVPDLDLIMVTTARSDLYVPYQTYMDPYDVLARYVLPAVKADAPEIEPGGVVHAPDHGTRLAPGVFARVSGHNFSLVETTWDDAMPADGRLPEGIGGVRVSMGGRMAYPSRVRDDEVQFLIPTDLAAGRYTVRVQTPQGSAYQEVEVAEYAPALYTTLRNGRNWASLEPTRPGTVIDLKASGLGPSVPPAPAGAVLDHALPLAGTPEVLVAGRPAPVLSAELASAGIWRVTIRVPPDVPPGHAAVQLRAGGVLSQAEAWLEIASRPRSRRFRWR
jgi:uncharacterized protein (TIGR03437 family)